MPAVPANLTIEQGATYRLTITWQDSEGNPVDDLTGWTVRMQIRKAQNVAPILTLTSAAEFTIDGPNAKVSLRISPAQTNTLSSEKYLYDVEFVTPDGDVTGDVYRILKGQITTDPNITQMIGSEVVVGP